MAVFVGEQVAVGRRFGVEELSEEHVPFSKFVPQDTTAVRLVQPDTEVQLCVLNFGPR
jgi:hypothetical protein